jgi:hypothetical protein
MSTATVDSIRRQIGGYGLLVVVSWRLHGADEAQTLAGDGPDQLLFPAIVATAVGAAIDTAGQRRFRHDPTAPDRSDQIILADDAVVVLHQVDQQVEHLRFNMDSTLCATIRAVQG